MTPGFNRYHIPDSHERNLADVAAWEARHQAQARVSPWWWVAAGAVLVVLAMGVAAVVRVVWGLVA